MALCENSLLRSLLGVKRTSLFAAQMSAFDPKRTSGLTAFDTDCVVSHSPLGCKVLG